MKWGGLIVLFIFLLLLGCLFLPFPDQFLLPVCLGLELPPVLLKFSPLVPRTIIQESHPGAPQYVPEALAHVTAAGTACTGRGCPDQKKDHEQQNQDRCDCEGDESIGDTVTHTQGRTRIVHGPQNSPSIQAIVIDQPSLEMGILEVLGSLPLFRLRGPFEELANVGVMFVVLQALRMITGLCGVALIEFLFHSGPMNAKERQRLASHVWYASYYTVSALWGYHLFANVTQWMYNMEAACSHEAITVSFSTWRSLHVYHCTQVAFYLNYLFAMAVRIDVLRHDWIAYGAHHVITIMLILFSRNWGYMRIQLAILVIHDAADPWVSWAKVVAA